MQKPARNMYEALFEKEGHFVPENIDRELVSAFAGGKLCMILRTCTSRVAQSLLPDTLHPSLTSKHPCKYSRS